jgi:ubiquinone/menaquinone biosynthesis C-methylase UbiE
VLRKNVQETYNREAKTYDLTRAIFEKGRFALRERELISEYLFEGSTVLVAGCGTGRHSKFLANDLKCTLVNIDLSPEMLRIARGKAKAEHIIANTKELPFRDEVFDAIICSRAFYLFEDKSQFLRGAYSCLRKKGLLLVSTNSKGLWITRLLVTAGLLASDPQSYPYNGGDLALMLYQVGFNRIETKCVVLYTNGISRFFPKFILALIRLLEKRLHDGRWVMAIGKKV